MVSSQVSGLAADYREVKEQLFQSLEVLAQQQQVAKDVEEEVSLFLQVCGYTGFAHI